LQTEAGRRPLKVGSKVGAECGVLSAKSQPLFPIAVFNLKLRSPKNPTPFHFSVFKVQKQIRLTASLSLLNHDVKSSSPHQVKVIVGLMTKTDRLNALAT